MTPLELRDEVKRITDPMYDVVCSSKLTQGEIMTVLKQAKSLLEIEIEACKVVADLREELMDG